MVHGIQSEQGKALWAESLFQSTQTLCKSGHMVSTEGRTDKWKLYFFTDETQNTHDVLDFYRTRFQLDFYFKDSKQHAGITNCQSTDFRKLAFHFNTSFTAVNLAKAACKKRGMIYSLSSCKFFIHNTYMLERFICVSGIAPNPQVITNFSKNSLYLRPGPLRAGEFLTNYCLNDGKSKTVDLESHF